MIELQAYMSVCFSSACLDQDHSLCELDAADSNTGRRSIPYDQYPRLDSAHSLPGGGIVRVVDTIQDTVRPDSSYIIQVKPSCTGRSK